MWVLNSVQKACLVYDACKTLELKPNEIDANKICTKRTIFSLVQEFAEFFFPIVSSMYNYRILRKSLHYLPFYTTTHTHTDSAIKALSCAAQLLFSNLLFFVKKERKRGHTVVTWQFAWDNLFVLPAWALWTAISHK